MLSLSLCSPCAFAIHDHLRYRHHARTLPRAQTPIVLFFTQTWTEDLVQHTGYTEEDLATVLTDLHGTHYPFVVHSPVSSCCTLG